MNERFSFIFDWGFRPFFVLGSMTAIVSLLYWVLALKGIAPLPETMTNADWHGHEMVFGFGGAALAGFLLTAVPSWTGTPQVRNRHLIVLVALWLLARLAVAFIDVVTVPVAALFNLAFIIGVAQAIIPKLWQQDERRHVVFLGVLFLYITAELSVFTGWLGMGEDIELSRRAIIGGIYALVYGIIVTSTRISMVVVRTALDEQKDTTSQFRPIPVRRNMAAATFLFYAIGDLIWPGNTIVGWIALAAGASQMDRLTDFHVGRVLLKPYVLIVYMANLWIGLGCIGMGINTLGELGYASDIRHLFAIGAMGTAILAVFTIAGLRHSGLALIVPKRIVIALGFLVAGVLMRITPTLPLGNIPYDVAMDVSATFFILTFTLYLSKFLQILVWDDPLK